MWQSCVDLLSSGLHCRWKFNLMNLKQNYLITTEDPQGFPCLSNSEAGRLVSLATTNKNTKAFLSI